MKDLRFKDGLNVDITYRTDMISDEDQNFTVSQIQVGPQFEVNDESDANHVALFNDFKKLENNITTFKDFATNNNLDLTIADSDGSNRKLLVDGAASVSASDF